MNYSCCDKLRRAAVENSPFNGIDFLEVLDSDAPADSPRQQTLLVRCLKAIGALNKDNVQITGGERVTPVSVVWAFPANAIPNALLKPGEIQFFGALNQPDGVLAVRTDSAGDYSTYRLSLRQSATDPGPPANFDAEFCAVDFSFKVECPSDFDCDSTHSCPPPEESNPDLNYLARDYASFRSLMLDRLALLTPQWGEHHTADVGMALVELLAFVGDYLSYQQDAIATEAYLRTARRRVSARRHARLVDYQMHDGCNARAFVQIKTGADGVLPARTQLLTLMPAAPRVIAPGSGILEAAMKQNPVVFETMQEARIFTAHGEPINLYTWLDGRCCLPKGATRATLAGHFPNLLAGDVLVLKEVVNPKTGEAQDADRARRHAVRLTHVVAFDANQQPLRDPVNPDQQNNEITEIVWHNDDSLPFPFCLSTLTDQDHGNQSLSGVSVALGNIVLADHGRTFSGADQEKLGSVPEIQLFQVPSSNNSHCQSVPDLPMPPRYNPSLTRQPLTFASPFATQILFGQPFEAQAEADLDSHKLPDGLKNLFNVQQIALQSSLSVQGLSPEWSVSDGEHSFRIRKEPPNGADQKLNVYPSSPAAAKCVEQNPIEAMPQILLTSLLGSETHEWEAKRDLLNSRADDLHFVVEVEADATATLRFGDDTHGARPKPQTGFTADYRVGNGLAGDIGAEAIAHIVTAVAGITSASNPLPAQGGVEQESVEQVRQYAPSAFYTQERAVTEADYAEVAQRAWSDATNDTQRAAATFRWTGSWHTVFVTVDRLGGASVDEPFREAMRSHLEEFRMAGHDLEVDQPRMVALELEMHICAKPDYFRAHVEEAVQQLFSNRLLPDGRKGLFHPDSFTLGQPIYVSPFYAAAQQVPGVASARIIKFQRQDRPDDGALRTGKLAFDRLEIARLDNDPDFPEHGIFRLEVGGGK
jgi:hypothetical protein